MPISKCHICGKSGTYTEMIDYTAYSVHPKCEHTLSYVSHNVKEFQNCSICKKSGTLSREEIRSHLIDNHTKESLADLIIDRLHWSKVQGNYIAMLYFVWALMTLDEEVFSDKL